VNQRKSSEITKVSCNQSGQRVIVNEWISESDWRRGSFAYSKNCIH